MCCQLNTAMELRPSHTLAERVSQLDANVFESLDEPFAKVSTIFPEEQLSDGLLHLVVSLIPSKYRLSSRRNSLSFPFYFPSPGMWVPDFCIIAPLIYQYQCHSDAQDVNSAT